MKTLIEKIRTRNARIGVIGLGYVGLPLAVEMGKAGFHVTGLDIAADRVASLNAGRNYIQDVSDQDLTQLLEQKRFVASTDFAALADIDAVSICVPTPLRKGKDPDISYILGAVEEVQKHLHRGQLIVLESTTYPGTTHEVVYPQLSKTGLKVGEDFFLAFSPERIDPGNQQYGLKNTPKVIGGMTANCTEIAQSLYQACIDRVIPVSSPQAAEMVKLLENTFRAINIGLANEIAIMCHRLNIDTWEVIDAAASKPFGFMPFYPGPGLGGHCIPIDPHYLLWKLRLMNYNARFIQLADEVNSSMPHLVVEMISGALNERRQSVKGSKVLILGVAYKQDIDDYRESPALDVLHLLKHQGAAVQYHDPFVPKIAFDGWSMESVPLHDVSQYDCVAILTAHSAFDIRQIVSEAKLVVDTRNATRGVRGATSKIVKL